MSVKLSGFKELQKALNNVKKNVDNIEVRKRMRDAAKYTAGIIQRNAPVKTGNLRQSIVAKEFKGKPKKNATSFATAFVAIDYRIAPHAHLVEYGHSRGAAPHPFFWRGVESAKEGALTIIQDGALTSMQKYFGAWGWN